MGKVTCICVLLHWTFSVLSALGKVTCICVLLHWTFSVLSAMGKVTCICVLLHWTFSVLSAMGKVTCICVLLHLIFQCSVSCGEGEQIRALLCRTWYNRRHYPLPEHMCGHEPSPNTTQTCRRQPCYLQNAQWLLSSWSQVSPATFMMPNVSSHLGVR